MGVILSLDAIRRVLNRYIVPDAADRTTLLIDVDGGECMLGYEISVVINRQSQRRMYRRYFAAARPEGPAPMIATRFTSSRVMFMPAPDLLEHHVELERRVACSSHVILGSIDTVI